MRHGDKINNLSRTTAHRKALLKNLACQLIEHKRINTTLAKAKALRVYVEPLITKAKNDSTHNRRLVFQKLQDKAALTELFGPISNKVADRPGGYTRIIKLQPRLGDAADMAMIELVDFNSLYNLKESAGAAKKTRRRRGGAKAKAGATPATEATEAADVAQAPATEATGTSGDAAAAASTNAATDDLTKIEGIGPKSAEAFQAAGLSSFAALAEKSAEELKSILDAADGNFGALDPATWPQQAQLAAEGKWDELKSLQDELKGGKAE